MADYRSPWYLSPSKDSGLRTRRVNGQPFVLLKYVIKVMRLGTDLTIYAMPDRNGLFALAELDKYQGELLGFLPRFYDDSRGTVDDEDRLFYAEVQRIKKSHPGIESRIFELYREYDQLHFLLSKNRRNGDFYADDYGTIAIRGERAIHANAVATQGNPYRFTPAASVAAVAAWLDATKVEELRANYDPELMEEAGVYKFFKDQADPDHLDRLCQYFEGLKAFHRMLVRRREGALVVID